MGFHGQTEASRIYLSHHLHALLLGFCPWFFKICNLTFFFLRARKCLNLEEFLCTLPYMISVTTISMSVISNPTDWINAYHMFMYFE